MVEFSHLTKAYKKRVAVDDFTLSVDVPIFGFLGQNGAGKTTIMKMIVGLLTPTKRHDHDRRGDLVASDFQEEDRLYAGDAVFL